MAAMPLLAGSKTVYRLKTTASVLPAVPKALQKV